VLSQGVSFCINSDSCRWAKKHTTSSPTADYKEAAESKYQRFEKILSTINHPNDFEQRSHENEQKRLCCGLRLYSSKEQGEAE